MVLTFPRSTDRSWLPIMCRSSVDWSFWKCKHNRLTCSWPNVRGHVVWQGQSSRSPTEDPDRKGSPWWQWSGFCWSQILWDKEAWGWRHVIPTWPIRLARHRYRVLRLWWSEFSLGHRGLEAWDHPICRQATQTDRYGYAAESCMRIRTTDIK